MNIKTTKLLAGFTLIELLVVMSIIAILVTLGGYSFRSAQIRAQDAQRKSDLKELSKALELFYGDHGGYPKDVSGKIQACPYVASSKLGTDCAWGKGEFSDGSTIYFKVVPGDPAKDQSYYYRLVPGSSSQKFQLFARLQNASDDDCIGGDCSSVPVSYSCGSGTCNFAITSPNASATE